MKKDYIYLTIILLLSLALFMTKVVSIQKIERVWKCEKYLKPYGEYQMDSDNVARQKKFLEEQKCYLNF